jgi:hypothetical protein
MKNLTYKHMICIALVILVAVVMMNILIPSPPPPPVTVEEWEFLDKIGNMAKRGWHSIADPVSKEVSDLGKKAKEAGGVIYDDLIKPIGHGIETVGHGIESAGKTVGKGIGSAATTVYDDVLTPVGHFVEYESTRPFGASTATYFGRGHSGLDNDHGFYYDWVKAWGDAGGGLAGLVGAVTGLVPAMVPMADDAAAGALSILGKPIRLISDKSYRDHFWDASSFGDNNWDHTLHPGGR